MHKTVAKCLLEVKSISFGFDELHYTYQGVRLPIYCDNRAILLSPQLRNAIAKWKIEIIQENFPDVELIVGTAVAGISFAVIVSEKMQLPVGYLWRQDNAIENGQANHCARMIKSGTKIVVVDDVLNTGNTLVTVAKKLRDYGGEILGATAIFSYGFDITNKVLAEENIKCIPLTNYDVLSLISMQTGKITFAEYKRSQEFKRNPTGDTWYK